MNNVLNIKVVIGSRKAYNECNERALGSEWINLDDVEDLDDLIAILKSQGFTDEELEETFIQDYEAEIELFQNCDYISKEKLIETCESLEDLEEYDIPKIKALIEYLGIEETLKIIRDNELDNYSFYEGLNRQEYAEQLFEDCYGFDFEKSPFSWIRNYIDFESMGRDMDYNGEIVETSEGVLVLY